MKCDYEIREQFIKHASSLIERDELAEKLGLSVKDMSCLINRMRKGGHEIWSINTDIGEWCIIYKGGDIETPKETLTDKIRYQLSKGWVSIEEMANNLDESRERVWGCLQGLYRSGEAARRSVLGMKPQYRIE